jgi:hypothetical protein
VGITRIASILPLRQALLWPAMLAALPLRAFAAVPSPPTTFSSPANPPSQSANLSILAGISSSMDCSFSKPNLSQLFSSGSKAKCFGTNRKSLAAHISADAALVLKTVQQVGR